MTKRPEPDAPDIEAQLKVAREVAKRRRELLRDLALAEQIMEEDRAILRALAKE